jgi:hypothetical protein
MIFLIYCILSITTVIAMILWDLIVNKISMIDVDYLFTIGVVSVIWPVLWIFTLLDCLEKVNIRLSAFHKIVIWKKK